MRKSRPPDGQRLGVERRRSEVRPPHDLAHDCEELLLERPDREVLPVGAGVDVVARVATVQEHPLPLRDDARGEVLAEMDGQKSESAVGHGHVDVLALAGASGAEESRQQTDHPEQGSTPEVGDLDAGNPREALVGARDERMPARPM